MKKNKGEDSCRGETGGAESQERKKQDQNMNTHPGKQTEHTRAGKMSHLIFKYCSTKIVILTVWLGVLMM